MTPTLDIYIERSPGIPGGRPWCEVRWFAQNVDVTSGSGTRMTGYSGNHLVDPPLHWLETTYVWNLIDRFADHCGTDRDHLDILEDTGFTGLPETRHLIITPGTGTR